MTAFGNLPIWDVSKISKRQEQSNLLEFPLFNIAEAIQNGLVA